MQILSVPHDGKRSFRIAVDIGQYHFVNWRGVREQWITQTPREWWEKQRWLKDGGYAQDTDTIRISGGRNVHRWRDIH